MTFEENEADAPERLPDERLVVDVDGYEGPLDLLLDLARRQKVDLQRISVLALADQFLAFVETARALRLELAADYLIMAAWLTLLKSRLLLPRVDAPGEPDMEEVAAALAERIRRLDMIRAAAKALDERPRVGRDTALRGMRDNDVARDDIPLYTATIFDLMSAYARQRQRQAMSRIRLRQRQVLSLSEARKALLYLVGLAPDWHFLDDVLFFHSTAPAARRTVRASTFAVALEMAHEGGLTLNQDRAFAPLRIRATRTHR